MIFKLNFLLIFTYILTCCALLDPNGYIAYCPCMGRFGNQADHFLGSLGFSKGLNRTLILPPWVEYRYGQAKSIQVPFDTYFKVDNLQKYHKVILMEDFMKDLAPELWPQEKRISFCYMARGSSQSCNAKEGNPFGPFWDTFNIEFSTSEFYNPLHYDVHNSGIAQQWHDKYPPSKYPVLAFTGAPASFPVQAENKELQKYLVWSDQIKNEAIKFVKNLPKGSFIGIHLRNGIDWIRACEHIKNSPSLFSAPQCLGYRNENGKATSEMCFPDLKLIVKQIRRLARNMQSLAAIVIASDSNHMMPELNKSLERLNIKIIKASGTTPHVELAIMAQANEFIGNCISSFSAFIVRERTARGLKSHFWGFPAGLKDSNAHDEL